MFWSHIACALERLASDMHAQNQRRMCMGIAGLNLLPRTFFFNFLQTLCLATPGLARSVLRGGTPPVPAGTILNCEGPNQHVQLIRMVWANIMLSSYIISWAGNGIWKIYCAQSTSELNTLNTNQPGLGARRCRTPAATSISKFSGQVKFPI